MTRRRPQAGLALLLTLLLAVRVTFAQGDAGVELPEVAEATSEEATRARHIRDLMAEELDVSIDPIALFELQLPEENDRDVAQLLESISAPEGELQPPAVPVSELWQARRDFLLLPSERQRELLQRHRERQAAAEEKTRQEREQEEATAALTERARNLEAFLAGELALDIDPRTLLSLRLLSPTGEQLSRRRAGALLGAAQAAEPAPVAPLDAALNRLDNAIARYLALPMNERKQLFAVHEERKAAARTAEERAASEEAEARARAEEATKARAEALAAAQAAESEGIRLLEEERARLLGIRERQASYRSELVARKASLDEHRERALKWNRRVTEAIATNAAIASTEYNALVLVLTEERRQLSRALDDLAKSRSDVPATDRPAPISVPDHVDDAALTPLRADIRDWDAELRESERKLRWETAKALRDGVVAMNKDRLRLLPHLPPVRRSDLRGFGPDGIAQARRELGQIALEVRYRAHAFPRSLSTVQDELGRRPLDTAATVLKLLLAILAFRFWRRRSTELLAMWRKAWIEHRPQTRLSISVAGIIWYAQRVRGPLEWLACFGVLGWLMPDVAEFPELGLLWRVVLWALIGTFAIRLIDAMAARLPTNRKDDTSQLRYRSLRIVGFIVVMLGLLLSLTESLVGQGAIYTWVWRLCWLLALPVGILLLVWWRPIIFARSEKHPSPNRFLRWAVARKSGFASIPATAVGGVALLAEGVMRWAVRQASTLAITRRFLAHLFRREVEKHAAEVDEAQYQPLAPDILERFAAAERTVSVDAVDAKHVERVSKLLAQDSNLVIAVVGERGLGKSRLLERLHAQLPADKALRVECHARGFESFVADLADAAGIDTRAPDELAEALRTDPPITIFVDDAQRLIKPLIGGLRGIDMLVRFAQRVGGPTSWVVGVGAPGWQYLRRARGDRAMFDDVVELKPWSEPQILALTRGLATSAEISPRFDELVVPRQMYDAQYTDAERSERDYCRILWDYSNGNPLVASFYFRESLAMKEDEVFLRLFKTPSLAGLEGAPGSLHFVLRSIVQLDLATESDIVACTDLQPADVADALRIARARGYVETTGEYLRIDARWYRAIVRFLKRQHLLVA